MQINLKASGLVNDKKGLNLPFLMMFTTVQHRTHHLIAALWSV